MQNMTKKLQAAGIVPPAPERTSFSDGRMAPKEAWKYCKEMCQARGASAPTLRDFKWHLRHGNAIKAQLERNPFSGGPDKIFAITVEDAVAFAEKYMEDPQKYAIHEMGGNGVVRRTPSPKAAPKPEKAPSSKKAEKEIGTSEAFSYIHHNVGKTCELNKTTFNLYLTYDVIPSRMVHSNRRIRVGDLDAFLELAPTGLYANHINYPVAPRRGPGDLTMVQAYNMYAELDPNPLTLSTFRTVVAAGILVPMRTANCRTALFVGLKRQDIHAFLALRERVGKMAGSMINRNKEPTSKPTPKKSATKAKSERWVAMSEGYEYYVRKAAHPLSKSWFRDHVYRGELFRSEAREDRNPRNPAGKMYWVDLDSIDQYLSTNPQVRPQPQKTWPLDRAYDKFRALLPEEMSKTKFVRLVRDGTIKSEVRRRKRFVNADDVQAYTGATKNALMQISAAFEYYRLRCSDPMAKRYFATYVTDGLFEGARKRDGYWVVPRSSIDKFLEQYPTGRRKKDRRSESSRKNRHIRSEASKSSATPKPKSPKPKSPKTSVPSPKGATSGGRIAVSMSDYASSEEMKKALDMLTAQGFTVQVQP